MVCSSPLSTSWRLSAGTALILSLAACGGGGGSSADSGAATPSGKISLGGVVAKGLTGNASIKVLGVASNGSVDESNVLATGQTDDAGVYSTTEFSAPAAYVVEVNAKACSDTSAGTGCSFHQDEATDTRQYLPTGFKMRAVVTTTPAGKLVNITPFSEMAVAAAESAPGGVTVANAQKGLAMVNALVGVADLNAVPPTTLSNATATSDQIRLAALLTAVSSLANSGSSLTTLGCTSTQGTPEATKCIVEKLADNATVEKYVGKDVNVTTALNTQLTAVVADKPEARALVTDTATKLTDPTQAVPTPPSASLTTAIDLVRGFFADLTSTVRTLLDSGTTPGQGAFLTEAHQFEAAVTGVDFQANTTQSAIQTLHAAAKLWTDFEHGSHVVEVKGRRPSGNGEVDYFWGDNALGFKCVLAKADDSAIAPTDASTLIHHVDCDADLTYEFYGTPASTYPVVHRQIRNGMHSYQVTKTGTNAFAYASSAVVEYSTADLNYSTRQVSNWTSASVACPQSAGDGSCTWADVRKLLGTVSTSTDAQGRIQTIHIVGDLPDGFKSGTVLAHAAAGITGNLAKTHLDLTADVSGVSYVDTSVTSGITAGTISFSGLTTAYGSNGTTFESSLEIGAGSAITVGSSDLNHGLLNLTMLTPGAKLVGSLETTRTTGNGLDASFTGSLFNLASSTTVPFISATLVVSFDNTHYVSADAYSSTNYQNGTVQFDGYITAPSHPKMRLIIGAGGRRAALNYNWAFDTYGTLAGSYIIYNADGSTKRNVTLTVASPLHNGISTTTLAEAASGLSFQHVDGGDKNVLVGGVTVGVISDDDTRLTFTNGDFISLDFGTVLY